MTPNVWSYYLLILKSRLLEEAIAQLWHDGLISGEMHLGSGEEAIIAEEHLWLLGAVERQVLCDSA